MAPLIMFKKNSIEKVRNLTNKLDANNPNNVAVYGKKYSKRNEYNKFNCDGNFSSIKLSKKNIELLKSNNISKIRFLIYRDSKMSTTTKMEEKNKTFLKEVLENIDKVNNGLEVKETVE
jgi:hypothetical protein